MGYTDAQLLSLAILPKTTGIISVLSSSMIALSVLRDPKKITKSYHRLLLGMSLVDVLVSFWESLATWPMPAESGAMFAMGSMATCQVQGFFVQVYIVSSFYSVSLAIYYTLVLRFDWSEAQIRKLEPYLHSVPLLWGLGTAIIGIPLKVYNPAGFWCWMAPYPAGCVGEECIRGANANTFRWAFFYGPLWANIFFVTIAMALVWQDVRTKQSTTTTSTTTKRSSNLNTFLRELERLHHRSKPTTINEAEDGCDTEDYLNKSDKELFLLQYDDQAIAEREWLTRKIKQDVAFQGFLYSGSFYLTWIWLTAVRFLQLIQHPVPYFLIALASFFAPLQGFFNMLIYLFPKFKAVKETNPEAGVVRWICDSLKV